VVFLRQTEYNSYYFGAERNKRNYQKLITATEIIFQIMSFAHTNLFSYDCQIRFKLLFLSFFDSKRCFTMI